MQRVTINAYAILRVSSSATQDEIRAAYRRLAREHHPDVNDGSAQAEERFKQLQAAYDLVKDREAHLAYDLAQTQQVVSRREAARQGVLTMTITINKPLAHFIYQEFARLHHESPDFSYSLRTVRETWFKVTIAIRAEGRMAKMEAYYAWLVELLRLNGYSV